MAIRGYREILVCQVILEEELVEETFDHSESFFKCRAYWYAGDISPDRIEEMMKYEI